MRSRYYQSSLDVNTLKLGQPYDELKKCIIIFICKNDLFHQKRCLYTFENICLEDHALRLEDGTKKIFINAAGSIGQEELSPELNTFIRYIADGTPRDEFTQDIDAAIQNAKNNKTWEVNYMKMECDLVDARAEGFQEGIEQGISQGIEQGISQGIEQGISQGIEQGISQGIEQGASKAKYEICKNALSMGLSPENVAVLTGLSIEEIKEIKQEL